MKLRFGEKFCGNCGAKTDSNSIKCNNTKIIGLIAIVMIITVIIAIIIVKEIYTENKEDTKGVIIDQNTILQIVDEFCNKNGYEMDISEEQINEIVEFYKDNLNNSEITIGDFLLEKGWLTKKEDRRNF